MASLTGRRLQRSCMHRWRDPALESDKVAWAWCNACHCCMNPTVGALQAGVCKEDELMVRTLCRESEQSSASTHFGRARGGCHSVVGNKGHEKASSGDKDVHG